LFKNILIFGHSNIGDTVYDLAVVDPLRQAYPKAKITFLASARAQDIASGYKGLDRIIVFNRHVNGKGFLGRLRFTFDLRKNKYDLIVVLNRSLNYVFIGASTIWRLEKDIRLKYKHPVDRYINLLRSKGLTISKASFSFGVKESDRLFRDKLLKGRGVEKDDKVVGIMPLAAWPLKSWPLDKWNELAAVLKHQYGIKVISLGKLPNNDLGRRFSEEMSDDIISFDDMTLIQVKALLERCQLFIGPDSSLLHLASCLGVEVIGLYGATSIDHFYPYFHRHNVLSSQPKLPCMPCCPGNAVVCAKDEIKHIFGPCMERIKVKDVLVLIKSRLKLE
jgi:ADP-heptose:LPS heptosyltransferase